MQNGIEVRAKVIVVGLVKQYQNRQEAVTLGGFDIVLQALPLLPLL